MHPATEDQTRCLRVRVNESLARRASHAAIDRGVTVSQLMREALEREVERAEAAPRQDLR